REDARETERDEEPADRLHVGTRAHEADRDGLRREPHLAAYRCEEEPRNLARLHLRKPERTDRRPEPERGCNSELRRAVPRREDRDARGKCCDRKRADDGGDDRPALMRRRGSRRRDHAALVGPRRCERPWVEHSAAEYFFGREAVGLGVVQIGLEVGRHLVRDLVRDPQAAPLAPALLDELRHAATSVAVTPRTASTASRADCHSATPAASARRPASDAR